MIHDKDPHVIIREEDLRQNRGYPTGKRFHADVLLWEEDLAKMWVRRHVI